MEMIIVISLTVIVMGIATSMFITGNRVFSDSDIKSTLQMEGQSIQEKISNIGMQASGIQSVAGNETSGEVQNIKINSYDKDGKEKVFEINRQLKKLIIDGNEVSGNVESIKIDSQIIKDYNKNPSLLMNYRNVNFDIILSKNRNYDNTKVAYSINMKTVFRNK